MLVTVKSREVQRGMLAEMRGEPESAARHLLAAAHLELVLATDYDVDDEPDLALRSRLSAASCFWRGGRKDLARGLLHDLLATHIDKAAIIEQLIGELEQAPADKQ
jgi:hypothetical protein